MSSVSGGLRRKTQAKLNQEIWDWRPLKRLHHIWADLSIPTPLTFARACLFIACVSLFQADYVWKENGASLYCLYSPFNWKKKQWFAAYLRSYIYALCSRCLDRKPTHLFYPETTSQDDICVKKSLSRATDLIVSGIMCVLSLLPFIIDPTRKHIEPGFLSVTP